MAFQNEKVCDLLLKKWHVVKEIHKILKPLYQATIAMQQRDFTLSDLYASWLQIERKMKKYSKKNWSTNLVTTMIDSMSRRKDKLLENPAMLCALNLDPRFCRTLNAEQKKVAVDTLETIWKRHDSIKRKSNLPISVVSDSDSDSSSDDDISVQTTTNLKSFRNLIKISNVNEVESQEFDGITSCQELRSKLESFIKYDEQKEPSMIFGLKVNQSFQN